MTSIFTSDNWMAAAFGSDVYRVGGSVRDELSGRAPKDADYVVFGQTMDSVRYRLSAFRHISPKSKVSPLKLRSGEQIGWRLNDIEVVLPRIEASTGPGRHDFAIQVDPHITLKEDAQRRDFTFNAIYKRVLDGELFDPTGRGLFDLERSIINTTHPWSFRDDPLRMLRALRFVSTMNMDLGSKASKEMTAHASAATGLNHNGNMSGTVWDELRKLLMGARPGEAVGLGTFLGPLRVLFPELKANSPWKRLEVAAHTDATLETRLALLFWDAGLPENLAAPKKVLSATRSILENRITPDSNVAALRIKFGDDLLKQMIHAGLCSLSVGSNRRDPMRALIALEEERALLEALGVPASVRDLKIDGRDCIEAGIAGPAIGEVLKNVLDEVNRDPSPFNLSRGGQAWLAFYDGRI